MMRCKVATTVAVGFVTALGPTVGTAAAHSATSTTGVHVDEPVVATASSTSVPNRYAVSFPTIRPGSDPADIKALTYLLLGNGVSSPVSTTYTTAVANAVKTYQGRHGLSASGTADPATVAALSTRLDSGTTSARSQAAAVLLDKHGYEVPVAAGNVSTLDDRAIRQVKAFQAGHGIVQGSYLGNHTWATLFAPKTSGPIFPQMQAGTGSAQWTNCGPVSAVVVELVKGKRPAYWNGNPDTNTAAVNYFRYTLAGVPRSSWFDSEVGTVPGNIIPALSKVGISAFSGNTNDVMAAARAGRPSIAGGDAYQLPWNRTWPSHVRGPASHFIAVVGWDGTNYLVVDPIAYKGEKNAVHLLTAKQLATFGATAPGWGPNVPGNNVPPSKNNIIIR